MPKYRITTTATAEIEEVWMVEADSPEALAEMLDDMAGVSCLSDVLASAEFISDRTLGEERYRELDHVTDETGSIRFAQFERDHYTRDCTNNPPEELNDDEEEHASFCTVRMGLGCTCDAPKVKAAELRAEALAICKAQPGYGSPAYRGDPYEAIILQQQADRLAPAPAWPCPYCDGATEHAPGCEMLSLMEPPVEQLPGGGVLA
jgi:hypothetical protein